MTGVNASDHTPDVATGVLIGCMMRRTTVMPRLLLFSFVFAALMGAAERVLIVADEIPAMEILARHFQEKAGASVQIVTQAEMPSSLEPYGTVVVYVHKELFEGPEHAILERTRNGGKLILLHHSISSGKRKNKEWFPALGVTLPAGKLEEGAYGYYQPADIEVVNVAPGHPVTTKGVHYDRQVEYLGGKQREGLLAPGTEIYLNHELQGPRTLLLGMKWTDPRSGKQYMQETAGWQKTLGRGSVFYFMVGHSARDFSIPQYAQILTNALLHER